MTYLVFTVSQCTTDVQYERLRMTVARRRGRTLHQERVNRRLRQQISQEAVESLSLVSIVKHVIIGTKAFLRLVLVRDEVEMVEEDS